MNFSTLNFKKWIDDHRDLLKPPVGNKQIWEDREFIVMVVGGPNARTDYHINEGEEFFYQVEGEMVLSLMVDGKRQDLPIGAGEIFLLPPKVPHSPRRKANSVGLVIERKRLAHEKDGFAWFCDKCGEELYREYVEMKNIEKDLPPVFDRFYAKDEHLKCKHCGHKMERPNA